MKATEVRERVFRCLDSLGTIIKVTEDRLVLYNKAHLELWAAAEDLYIALLSAAEVMLAWLRKSSASMCYPPDWDRGRLLTV